MDAGERTATWPWIVLVIVAPVVGLIAVLSSFVQVGRCVDYTEESGLQSFCESEPLTASPIGFTIAAVCAALLVLAVVRLVQQSRRRAAGS